MRFWFKIAGLSIFGFTAITISSLAGDYRQLQTAGHHLDAIAATVAEQREAQGSVSPAMWDRYTIAINDCDRAFKQYQHDARYLLVLGT